MGGVGQRILSEISIGRVLSFKVSSLISKSVSREFIYTSSDDTYGLLNTGGSCEGLGLGTGLFGLLPSLKRSRADENDILFSWLRRIMSFSCLYLGQFGSDAGWDL